MFKLKKEYVEYENKSLVLLSERLGKGLEKDARYKAAISEEERLYELLDNSLNEEQQNMLKNYFDATNSRELHLMIKDEWSSNSILISFFLS